jgi:hypothetical protein
MQLPEKYKENFDISSEGPWSRVIFPTPASNSRRRRMPQQYLNS